MVQDYQRVTISHHHLAQAGGKLSGQACGKARVEQQSEQETGHTPREHVPYRQGCATHQAGEQRDERAEGEACLRAEQQGGEENENSGEAHAGGDSENLTGNASDEECRHEEE